MATKFGRIARTTLKGFAAALLVVLVTVVVLLTTPAGLRLALRIALPIYDDAIAGSVAIAGAEGRLLGGFTLRGVTLSDRDGRALVTVDALALRWRPRALLRGELAIESLTLERPRVHLPGAGAGFADLAPPSENVPKDMSLPPGPDLPLGVAVTLHARDAAVFMADGSPLVEAVDLDVRARGAGRAAEAEVLAGRGRALGSREIEALSLRARWAAPLAAIDDLRLIADAAALEVPRARLDVRSLRGALDLRARAALGLLAEYLPEGTVEKLRAPAGTLALAVAAEGVPEDMSGEIDLALAPAIALHLAGAGAWRGVPRADLSLTTDVDLGPWTGGRLGRVRPAAELHAVELGSGSVGLAGGLRCPECDDLGGVALDVEGVVAGRGENMSLGTSLEVAGVGALVDVVALGGALQRLDWRLSAVDLARPAAVAREFAAVPQLRGTLTGRGACTGSALRCVGTLELQRLQAGEVELERARVEADVSEGMSRGTVHAQALGLRAGGQVVERGAVRLAAERLPAGPVAPPVPAWLPPLRADLQAAARGRAGWRADVDMSARTGQQLTAELRALMAEHAGFRATLERPARAVLSGSKLEIDELALAIAGGRVAIAGVVDADGPSDLQVDVTGLPLARLRPLVPRLRPAGLASARVRLRGRPEAPSLQADLKIAQAGLRGGRLGDLAVAASLDRGRGKIEAELHGPLARRLALGADLPLRIDLANRTWSIGPAYSRVELRAEEVRLARLRPWLKPAELRGRVDGFVRLEASGEDLRLATPRLLGEWRGRKLVAGGVAVGDVALSFSHRGEWLQGKVDVHRFGDRARLDVQLPLELDLARGRVAWRREREHRALLQAEDLDLTRQLEGLAAARDVAGKVNLWAELTGPATAPTLQAELRGEALQLRRIDVGSASLSAVMRDGGSSLDLSGGGGQAGRFEVRALAPVALDVSGVRWRRDGWYALEVDLHALELATLAPLVGVDLGGWVNGGVTFDGTGRRPRLRGSVQGDRLSLRGEPVGMMRAELALRDGTAELVGHGRLGEATRVAVDARVPVDVDLAAGELAWTMTRPGKLRLDVTGFDRAALAPFKSLPPQAVLDLDVHAQADVDAEHLRGRAEVKGAVGHRAANGLLPVQVQLDVDDAKQALRGSLGLRDRKGSLTFAADTTASIPALRRGEGSWSETPIRGEVHAEATDLRHVSGFLPEEVYDLRGLFTGELALRGSLGEPSFRGSATLKDGGVTVVPLQQRLRDLNLEIAADGRRVTLTRLTATSGEGRLKASGAARFSPGGELTARANLDLRKFPVVRPGLPQMIVDTYVRADLSASPSALAVAFEVDGAKVWVSELTTRAPDPVPENANVTIVNGPLPALRPTGGSPVVARNAPTIVDVEDDDPPAPKDMELKVRLAQPVHIQGPSMDMNWTGALALHQRGESSEVTGSFRSDRGRFELMGTRFQIDQGRVFLPEDGAKIDPYIDLTADARTPQADVTVTLRGRLSRPDLRLSSRPAMTEDQIFALLMTGSADTQESNPKKTQASAAGLLVNFSNPTLSRFAEQKLGIDRIKFGFADDITQPVLSVGKHLTKSIYAETSYHHNAPPRTNRIEGSIEYRFAPRWSIETFFGDAAVGGLDVFWRRQFGRSGAPEATSQASAK